MNAKTIHIRVTSMPDARTLKECTLVPVTVDIMEMALHAEVNEDLQCFNCSFHSNALNLSMIFCSLCYQAVYFREITRHSNHITRGIPVRPLISPNNTSISTRFKMCRYILMSIVPQRYTLW